MSTAKVINVQHPANETTNIVNAGMALVAAGELTIAPAEGA